MKTIVKHIKNQENEDQLEDKIGLKKYKESLRVSKNDKGSWESKTPPKSGWSVKSLEGDGKTFLKLNCRFIVFYLKYMI